MYQYNYKIVLNYLIAKYGDCHIVRASINPKAYGMTLYQVIELGTSIYRKDLGIN